MKIIFKIFFYLSFFTGFTLNSQSRITYFNTIAMTDSVRLNFTISAGVSCSGWQVLKGSDSLNLFPIYTYGGLCGNTTTAENHTYTDISPNKAVPNFYRIFIPPNDYSALRRVDLAASFTNMLIYPQPTENALFISISNVKNFYYEIKIFDRFGRRMGDGNGNALERIELNVSGFPLGLYTFYIIDLNGNTYRGKFLKN